MKCFFRTVFVVLFSITTSATAFAQDANKDKLTAQAREMEEIAMGMYMVKPDSAISNLRKAADLYQHAGNYRATAAVLQNAAFVSDDYKKDNYKAAELMRESLVNWRKTTDTQSIANAYKYTVMQHTKFNDAVGVGKKRDTAVMFFTALNDYKSISDMYLATATMYEGQRLPDSSIKYATMALDVSKKTSEPDVAAFKANSILYRLYVVDGRFKEAKSLMKKLNKTVKSDALKSEDKLPFYYYAWVYYDKNNNEKKATEYKTQYDELKKSVK